jgi:hypothetical protein
MWNTTNTNNEDENLIVDAQNQDYEVHVFLPGAQPNQPEVETIMRTQTEQTGRTAAHVTKFVFFDLFHS